MEALMIGVSGLRGTVGGTLTPPVVSKMAAAFAAWLAENEKPANGKHFRVAFGRDSRPAGHGSAMLPTPSCRRLALR